MVAANTAVPPGHSLYRAPGSATLRVVPDSEIVAGTDDDRHDNGKLKCSRAGTGRVLPECEKLRSNPFARK